MTLPQEFMALALGSNLGDRVVNLQKAVKALQPFVTIHKASPIYETPAAYVSDQPAFLNAVLTGTTTLEPLALLHTMKDVEAKMGRMPTFRYGPRLIDLDIIFYGNKQIQNAEIEVPHPRMAEREFVMRPLADILPQWQHPHTGRTATDMLADLPEQEAVRIEATLL